MHKKISFFIILVLFPVSSLANFQIIPMADVFYIDNALVDKDGYLRSLATNTCYRVKVDHDLVDMAKRSNYPQPIVIRPKNGKEYSYIEPKYYQHGENVVIFNNGLVVSVFRSGGSGCCSELVSFMVDKSLKTFKLVDHIYVNHPEVEISNENVGDFDGDGNVEIQVQFGDWINDDKEQIPNNGIEFYYNVFIRINKNGSFDHILDRKLYEKDIRELIDQLKNNFNYDDYGKLVFYNQYLELGMNEKSFLSNMSDSERDGIIQVIDRLYSDRPDKGYYSGLVERDVFNLVPVQICK